MFGFSWQIIALKLRSHFPYLSVILERHSLRCAVERIFLSLKFLSSFEGASVLLVEDEEQVLGMAVESLEELHYRVTVRWNAAEAPVHRQDAERIDSLFSDVTMPGSMNGLQLAVEAQRLRPWLKVHLTSASDANLDGVSSSDAKISPF